MVQNGVGEWIFRYNRHMGKCSAFDMEL
ncbi:hypothetical protein Gogos_012979 [Gossypium gossypioides]|uniref:Uncharacterized protein n=1 Tax=Gossypium gossypioides TaxID=34282 RepID=A0A7J9BU66_GOSGO|nr:hypothetical protein [Gossypium gossypioides]